MSKWHQQVTKFKAPALGVRKTLHPQLWGAICNPNQSNLDPSKHVEHNHPKICNFMPKRCQHGTNNNAKTHQVRMTKLVPGRVMNNMKNNVSSVPASPFLCLSVPSPVPLSKSVLCLCVPSSVRTITEESHVNLVRATATQKNKSLK